MSEVKHLPRILVVDDENGPRLALAWILRKYKIAEAIQCSTAEESLAALRAGTDVQVAVVDLRMPDMLGTDLVRKLKAIRPGLKAVLHTGYNDLEESGMKEDQSLFCAILPKPAPSNQEVANIIGAVLSSV